MQDQINALKMTVKDLVDRASSCTGASCAGTAGTAIGASGDIHQLVQRPSRRRVSTAPKTSFQGPTTSGFGFDLAKTSLLRRGIVEENDAADGVEGNVTQEPSPLASSPVPGDYEEQYHAVDPLCTFTRSEALRLCALYEEEMGIMYPVIEVPELLQQVHRLYSLTGHRYLDQALAKSNPVLGREDMAILRLVFACALTAEASGRSDRAIALLTSVRDIQEDCVWGPPELKSITILTLVVSFRIFLHQDPIPDRGESPDILACCHYSRSCTSRWMKRPSHGARSELWSECVWRKGFIDQNHSII